MVRAYGRRAGARSVEEFDAESFTTEEATISGRQAWEEDGNSPGTLSGNSTTYSLAGEFDEVVVAFDSIDPGTGSTVRLAIQIEGDTGTNYRWHSSADGNVSGATDAGVALTAGDNGRFAGAIWMTGRWSGQWNLGNYGVSANASGREVLSAKNKAVSSPLTQFTLLDNNDNASFSGEFFVYGRDYE